MSDQHKGPETDLRAIFSQADNALEWMKEQIRARAGSIANIWLS